jgi:predicted alpha-1,6-mannanase (GH76 family)
MVHLRNLKAREALKAILQAWKTKPHENTPETFDTFHFWFSAHIEKIEAIAGGWE